MKNLAKFVGLFVVLLFAPMAMAAPVPQTIDPSLPEPVMIDESALALRVDDLTAAVNAHTEALATLAANDEALEARLAALEAARPVQSPQITYKAAQLRTSLLAPPTAPKAVAAQAVAAQGKAMAQAQAAPYWATESVSYGPARVVSVGPPVVTYSEPYIQEYTEPYYMEPPTMVPVRATAPTATTTRAVSRTRAGLFGGGGLFRRPQAMQCGPNGCF